MNKVQGEQHFRLSCISVIYYPQDGIAELIADEGITLSAEHAREIFNLIEGLAMPPQAILVNRQNSYALSFEAFQLLSSYKGITALAILTHSRLAFLAAKFTRAKHYHIAVFMQREAALDWLRVKLNDDNSANFNQDGAE